MLNYYKQVIALRQKEPALHKRDDYPVITGGNVLAYTRKYEGSPSFLIVLNCTGETGAFKPQSVDVTGRVVLSTIKDRRSARFTGGAVSEANEGVVVQLI